MSHAEKKYRRVSVLNWMGTFILYAIPGVNLIAAILFIIFAKAQAKRSSAIALLLLIIIFALLISAAFIFLPAQMAQLRDLLLEPAKSAAPLTLDTALTTPLA